MILSYNLLFIFMVALAAPVTLPTVVLSEKRRKTVLQRLGFGPLPKLGGKPIWVHALSVGETISAVPFIRKLKNRFPDETIVFSASTLTGWEIANTKLEGIADALFYFPRNLQGCHRQTRCPQSHTVFSTRR